MNKVPNPTGKGGFGDNPQNRCPNWSKETSISYWQNYFIRRTIAELEEWNEMTPDSERTAAQQIAYNNVMKAKDALDYQKELSDRTEGKPKQVSEIDLNASGQVNITPKEWIK